MAVACTQKASEPAAVEPHPQMAATTKAKCTTADTPHYPDPKSAVIAWNEALLHNDFCKYILSYSEKDRVKVTTMATVMIAQSGSGPQHGDRSDYGPKQADRNCGQRSEFLCGDAQFIQSRELSRSKTTGNKSGDQRRLRQGDRELARRTHSKSG